MAKQDVTRHIKQPTQLMLWGLSAGRCQFADCNKRLWENGVTKEQVNIAQKAHIWSFSEGGPRGNAGIESEHINDLQNLMLVCHECHKQIDNDTSGIRYSVGLLQKMKRAHEDRIDLAASISPNKQSHILLYGANVGEHSSPVNYRDAAEAIFPDYYPAERSALELGLGQSPFRDRSEHYWEIEKSALKSKFNTIVRERMARGEIKHLSVFGLAPQPLLICLGTLLSDIPDAKVYQRHREPTTWRWQNSSSYPSFQVIESDSDAQSVALNISLSANVDNSRIHNILGEDISIWTLRVDSPHNDVIRSANQLQEFRQIFRGLMNRIKSVHGHGQTLHVFPAAPVSVAVEIGRTWMPKADMPLSLYDEVRSRGGFVKAFDL